MDDVITSQEYWERLYQGMDPAWGTRPNVVFAGLAEHLDPGSALELGCGHGGDALWLAARGWTVTAADVSATALARVAAAAATAQLGDRVRTERHDLTESLPDGTFDLAYACYFQTPLDIPRDAILHRAAGVVAEGGRFIVVDHASAAPWSSKEAHAHRFPPPGETLAAINPGSGWQVERAVAAQRTATGPGGQTAVVTDNIIVLRRD